MQCMQNLIPVTLFDVGNRIFSFRSQQESIKVYPADCFNHLGATLLTSVLIIDCPLTCKWVGAIFVTRDKKSQTIKAIAR